jgi:4-carboxymuconolactone decarboxylase
VSRLLLAALGAALTTMPVSAQEQKPSVAPEDMHWVAPALAGYTDEVLFGDVWERTELTPRDRSLATLSALIAAGNTAQMTGHLGRALDNGVTPAEISGLITHLAFYSGWPKAVSALGVTRQVLEARGITAADMQAAPAQLTQADRLLIVRAAAGPSTRGSESNFTGAVQVSGRFSGTGRTRSGGATVTFEAGARTAWHRHEHGQTLVVTAGCGFIQREGGRVDEICAGDVAVTAPGEAHWHGATATSAMAHVALSEPGKIEWLNLVTDAEYPRGPR